MYFSMSFRFRPRYACALHAVNNLISDAIIALFGPMDIAEHDTSVQLLGAGLYFFFSLFLSQSSQLTPLACGASLFQTANDVS